MAFKKITFLSFKKIAVFISIISVFGCASVQKPQGGPRDRVPPKLLRATPADKTKNFTAKEIVLSFDEFFKLSNQYQEISISPAQEKLPEYRVKQKNLVINLKDSLRKNTTYVINFGKAIGDVNENNILKNFTYVFTTGNEIDSLGISGKVFNSETQEPEKEATVFIFTTKQDSAWFGKKKPSYYTTTDTAGNFKLSNLHADSYQIYALKESASNKIYDNDQELIAILPKVINLKKDTANIRLELFKQIPQKFRIIDRKIDQNGRILINFNKGIENPDLKIISPANLDNQKVVEFNKEADSASLYIRNMEFDSVKIAIISQNKALDTVVLRKGKKEVYKRTFGVSTNATGGLLKPKTDLVLTTNFPIESTNEAQIVLNEDSVPKYGFSLQKDTSSIRKYTLKYTWRLEKKYDITFNEGALIDIYGNRNRKFTASFQLNKEENYSSMVFKINLPDPTKAYLFELLNDEKKIIRSVPINKSQSLTFTGYSIGKYRIRVVYDLNKNGKWNTGNVKSRTLPEPIWYYNKEISLRANWELNETIDVPKPIDQ